MTGGKSTMSEKRVSGATRDNYFIIGQELTFGNEYDFGELNKACVSGIIEDEFEYSHEVYGRRFYKNRLRVARFSGVEDCVPIMVSDFIMPNIVKVTQRGRYIKVIGQFRSYNQIGEDGQSHLRLFLFVKAINLYDSEKEFFKDGINVNSIFLDGYICRQPVFRTTPLKKQITDFMLAVNRSYKKSDYIPCIAWGIFARYIRELDLGDRIKLYGRIQSRQYIKRLPSNPEVKEKRTAYEISITRITKINDVWLND